MSRVIAPVERDGRTVGYMFTCPGCQFSHVAAIANDFFPNGSCWSFDGNQEAPTFTPSLKNNWDEGEDRVPKCCHLNITKGQLVFHGDCTHALAGKTVPMVDVDQSWMD